MSFSSEIKKELGNLNNLSNKKQVKYELIGYLISNNTNIVENTKVRYATESQYNINRYSKLLRNLNINHKIEIDGKIFIITSNIKDINIIEICNKEIYIKDDGKAKDENARAIMRGLFLGSGSINNPESKYHMEMTLSNRRNLNYILKISGTLKISFKILEKKGKFTIYLKEGEEISNLLVLIGANKGVLKFEDIRVHREMRGKINRIVNCKSANLNKTINASVQQIEAIKKLKKEKKFNYLDDNLKEIADLRLENPDLSLIELAKLLKIPIGKSGVNYRLRKIIELANEG